MGFPYHELIPAAILLDTPGLTKNELGKKLLSTHYSAGVVERSAPWDTHEKRESFTFQDLPRILGLKYSRAFLEFKRTRRDQNGISLFAPEMRTAFQETKDSLVAESYQVITHVDNELGEMQTISVSNSDRRNIHEGQVVEFIDEYLEGTNYWVRSIVGRRAQVQRVTPQIQTETFATLDDLYSEWPQFRPENMFDFSQAKGDFVSGWTEGFMWKLVDGKYYLDEQTFNQISASFGEAHDFYSFGYTDLILTAEAIKQGAWKLLSYRGLIHLGDFLRQFPDSRARYEQAVWDSHTSLAAKRKGMTNTQFLRMRLFPPSLNNEEEQP